MDRMTSQPSADASLSSPVADADETRKEEQGASAPADLGETGNMAGIALDTVVDAVGSVVSSVISGIFDAAG